jgi:hypothetical protein
MWRGVQVAAKVMLLLLVPSLGGAQTGTSIGAGTTDRTQIEARSETYLRVFERALLPGPNGAIVDVHTLAPIHEYLSVRARAVDAPWSADSVDAEVSVWGAWVWGERPARRFEGDVTSAFIQQRLGPARLRVGRQSFSSAAAQYVRFDGLRAGAVLLRWLGADAYAGYSVLPRWDARPGYQHLGSVRDGLLRDPEVSSNAARSGWMLAGGRLGYDAPLIAGGLSFHAERQQHELARRNVGLDLRLAPLDAVSVSANATVTPDSGQLIDARAWVDWTLSPSWRLDAEYLHTDPALVLSRQSVLSVFGTSAFDEWGGALTYRPLRHLAMSASAYAQRADGEGLGMRSLARLWTTLDAAERWRLSASHIRLRAVENGYHSLRAAVGYAFSARLSSNADLYVYRYDEPILGRRYSLVQAFNVGYRTESAFALLCGISLVQSPYAQADLQSLVRVTHELDSL